MEEKENINAPLFHALEELKDYFSQQLTFNKLLLSKKLSELSAGLLLFIILAVVITLALLAFSSAFVYWFSYYFGLETYIGYLVLTGFYAIIGIIVFSLRKKLIYNPVRKLYGQLMFLDADVAEEETEAHHITPKTFDNKEDLDDAIEKMRENISKQEEELKYIFDEVSHQYTLRNITMQMAKNAYSSFVTTTNIAKAAFMLLKKVKGKKKRHHKKLKE
jgi:hypothetical protein